MPSEDQIAEEVRHQFRALEHELVMKGPSPDLSFQMLVLQSGSAEVCGDRQVRAWVDDPRYGPRYADLIAEVLDRACRVVLLPGPQVCRTGPVEYQLSW